MSTTTLHYIDLGNDHSLNLIDKDGNTVAILNPGGPLEGANARRLVAC